jgi:membrane carboxypeptidase/penicillin-binding protein
MININGITGAAPIWHNYMEMALAGTPVHDFAQPTGMVSVRVCDLDGGLANPWDGAIHTELYPADAVPKKQCGTQAPAPTPPPTAPEAPALKPATPPTPETPVCHGNKCQNGQN